MLAHASSGRFREGEDPGRSTGRVRWTMILPKSPVPGNYGGLDSVAFGFPSDRIAQDHLHAGGYVVAPIVPTFGKTVRPQMVCRGGSVKISDDY